MGHERHESFANENRWDLPFSDSPEIHLFADYFSIVVEPISEGETPHLEMKASGKPPRVVVEREGNAVRVGIGHDSGIPLLDWIPWGAGSKMIVRVPPNIRGRFQTGAGTLRASDLNGCDLELATDAGTIRVDRIRGKLRLHTAAGTIDGNDLAGSFDVETSAGTVDLRIGEIDPGKHRVHTSAGTVRVDLSRDISAHIEASSSFGGSRVSFPSDPRAAASLVVTSDAGTVRVRGSDKIAPPRRIASAFTADAASPYRRNAVATVASSSHVAVDDDAANEELERVLRMVADGTITPNDASEILRALGHA